MSSNQEQPSWTFLTNHTQVLLCIAQDVDIRLRDVAERVGLTERAAQRIVADLVEAGIIERRRVGRRNHYLINRKAAMRHAAQAEHRVGPLLDLLQPRTERPDA
ncbi:MAG: helix-turn-helix transcriptional regulator [Chloroflexota bacterium]